MDKTCPNKLCDFIYKPKKKPFKCPLCDAYIGKEICMIQNYYSKILDFPVGGKYVPAVTTKKKNDAVIKLDNNHFSVHTNQIYRTVCHVPPGMMRFIHLYFVIKSS